MWTDANGIWVLSFGFCFLWKFVGAAELCTSRILVVHTTVYAGRFINLAKELRPHGGKCVSVRIVSFGCVDVSG